MTLLEIEDLVVEYPRRGFRSEPFRALDHVNVTIAPGETVGLVGESGSGKTTLGRSILGLTPVAQGTIRYNTREIQRLNRKQRRSLATELQAVFQDPYSSLNPAMTVGTILAEPLVAQGLSSSEARERVTTLLDRVHMPPGSARRYAREFSGGQRQRIAIARALALRPRLIICDEAVSALDLSTQAKILDLFIELQEQTDVAYLFVSHDLEVVRYVSHRVAVLLKGQIVEHGYTANVIAQPDSAYTRRLLNAAPVANPRQQAERRRAREATLPTDTTLTI